MFHGLKFHHVGLATSCLDLTIKQYQNWGYSPSQITQDKNQKVRICFMSRPGFPLIELIEPADPASPVNNILKKSGTSPYHFCYEIPEIEQQIELLKRQNIVLVQKPVAAPALGNRKICFIFHKEMGLVEFVESTPEN